MTPLLCISIISFASLGAEESDEDGDVPDHSPMPQAAAELASRQVRARGHAGGVGWQ